MGGLGSGRHSSRDCTCNMKVLDVRMLQRQRLLAPGNSLTWSWSRNGEPAAAIRLKVGAASVTLDYRLSNHSGEWRPINFPVRLTWTDCNFGGRRAWWLCPADGCGRRVALLFGGDVFACRHCHRLAYQCQREANDARAARRAEAIRMRLDWGIGVLNPKGCKPKGMHWRTFERLEGEHDFHLRVATIALHQRLKRFGYRSPRSTTAN
jgi:hypothetical protein